MYPELIRKGWRVSIGKIGALEIDFAAEYGGDRIYYQVTASVLNPATFARELAPLQKVPDHYSKFIISMDEISMSQDDIKQINIISFRLEKSRF